VIILLALFHTLEETVGVRSSAEVTTAVCRSIQTLFNCDPPADDDELRAAALQFVRKISGYRVPSRANAAAFDRAVEEVFRASRGLLDSLTTGAPPRSRDLPAARRPTQPGSG
jgi:hypothetical protein